jgi:hypothetical protein
MYIAPKSGINIENKIFVILKILKKTVEMTEGLHMQWKSPVDLICTCVMDIGGD